MALRDIVILDELVPGSSFDVVAENELENYCERNPRGADRTQLPEAEWTKASKKEVRHAENQAARDHRADDFCDNSAEGRYENRHAKNSVENHHHGESNPDDKDS